MRPWPIVLLSFTTGSVFVRDIRLAMLFTRGGLTRVVIDRQETGIIVKAHLTQAPSAEDTALLLVWAAMHLAIIAIWYCCLLRRNRGICREGSPESQGPIVGSVARGFRRMPSRSAVYWALYAASQALGIACLAFAGMPARIMPVIVSIITLIPGSLIANLNSAPQLGGAMALNLAAWFVAKRWSTNSQDANSNPRRSG